MEGLQKFLRDIGNPRAATELLGRTLGDWVRFVEGESAGGGEGGDEAGEQQQQEEEAAADANSSASAAASTAATTATEASASAAPAPPAATTTTEQPATKRQRTGVSGSATASRRWKPTDVAVTTAAPSTGVRPFAAARGHTSYLTFGRLYPTHATAAAAPAAAAAAAE